MAACPFPAFGTNPVTGEWNDSLAGDSLWSNVNASEAVQALAGCGNAAQCLKTGGRVRVDGGLGRVERITG